MFPTAKICNLQVRECHVLNIYTAFHETSAKLYVLTPWIFWHFFLKHYAVPRSWMDENIGNSEEQLHRIKLF